MVTSNVDGMFETANVEPFVIDCKEKRSTKENQHDQSAIDLRLKPSARSRDKGKRLTYFSDGYESDAPDLGAYEFGAMIPHYGPRTKVADE